MDWAFWRKPPPVTASVTAVAAPIVSAPDPVSAPAEVTGAALWGCGHRSESGAWSPVSETSCCLACHQGRIS